MMSSGASEISGSDRISTCTSMKAPSSVGASLGSSFHSVCSSRCTAASACCRRATSASRCWQFVPQRLQFAVHGGQRLLQARHFRFEVLFGDQIMFDVERGRREHVRAADGDAARNRDAVQREGRHALACRDAGTAALCGHYSPSPNLSLTSAASATTQSFSSAPSASSVTLAPLPAASIITPMMDLALMRRELRVSQTSLWYLAASWVNLAEARACKPSLLIISSSC